MPLPSTVISSFFGTMNTRTSYYPFDFLSYSFDCTSYLIWGDNRTSAVPITYLSSTSPSSLIGGCHHNLALTVTMILSAVNKNTSTISNLIIISKLNHFTFVSALLLPVLRLNLTLSLRLQWTRYRRLVRPYLIGFSYCIIISLPKLAELLPPARGNQLCWFLSSHPICRLYHRNTFS